METSLVLLQNASDFLLCRIFRQQALTDTLRGFDARIGRQPFQKRQVVLQILTVRLVIPPAESDSPRDSGRESGCPDSVRD